MEDNFSQYQVIELFILIDLGIPLPEYVLQQGLPPFFYQSTRNVSVDGTILDYRLKPVWARMWLVYNSHFLATREDISQWRVLLWESFGLSNWPNAAHHVLIHCLQVLQPLKTQQHLGIQVENCHSFKITQKNEKMHMHICWAIMIVIISALSCPFPYCLLINKGPVR